MNADPHGDLLLTNIHTAFSIYNTLAPRLVFIPSQKDGTACPVSPEPKSALGPEKPSKGWNK